MLIRRLRARLVQVAVIVALAYASATPVFAEAPTLPEPVGMAGDRDATLVLAGNAAFLAGHFADAARDYARALRGKPDFAVARFNLGLLEAHTSARAAGLRDMDRGISLAEAHGMNRGFTARLRALRAAFVRVPTADA